MLSPTKILEVQTLIEEGRLSFRAIAEKAGISRGSVAGIARGDVDLRVPRPDDELLDSGPVERCPTCGGTVFLPCRLCRTRAWKAERDDRRRTADERSAAAAAKLRPEQPRDSGLSDTSRRPRSGPNW